jgi:hypothetical protein
VPFLFLRKWLIWSGLWGRWKKVRLTVELLGFLRFWPGEEGIPQGLKPQFLCELERAKAEEAAEKVDFRSEAFPQRLKPDSFFITYGAAEAAPFQNGDYFSTL